MILEYRGVDLWDTATGRAILEALGDEQVPPPLAAAWMGQQASVSTLDVSIGLSVLAAALFDHPDLVARVERASAVVTEMLAEADGL